MKTGIGIILGVLLLLFSLDIVKAQSPIQCGLVGESCCNLAGSPPNSCKTGLVCSGGTCISDGISPVPPSRTEVGGGKDSGSSDPTCDGRTGIKTAIGCIHVLGDGGPEQFLGELLKWAVGIGGGIAFLLIVYASFMIMTSAGNPERLKAGQELLTSAISGLILLVLSIFVLKFIGIDILKLCNFGFGTCPQ